MASLSEYISKFTATIAALLVSASVSVSITVSATASVKKEYLRPIAVPAPKDNLLTQERAELGKKLFFDPRLSGSNWISCATCHNPALGWSDGLPTAIGHGQQVLDRATPTILNSAYNHVQMWDGRFRSLEKQALAPIEAAGEMNQNLDELVTELKAIDGYVKLFTKAYPGEGISKKTIAKAIASFERTVVSTESPFDRWILGDENAISDMVKEGFALFEGKARCAVCHSGFNFTDDSFHNVGLKSSDEGRYAIRKVKVLKGAFKTPTLRNINQTAPYMHNGQYKTLMEVVEHYDRGGDVKDNLSPNIKPLNLSMAEKRQLVEFMNALTGKPLDFTVPRLPH